MNNRPLRATTLLRECGGTIGSTYELAKRTNGDRNAAVYQAVTRAIQAGQIERHADGTLTLTLTQKD